MVYFAFGVHNHQPLENQTGLTEELFQRAYLPFLTKLKEFKEVRVTYHVSGCLLEWLQEHHTRYVEDLKELADDGRIELMASGIYEPILALVPEEDRRAQIKACLARLSGVFGHKPRGLWLTEQVWEQRLARTLSEAGIEYVVLDDVLVRNAGVAEPDLFGYYVTEDQGRTLAVFPSLSRLRYLVPFRDAHETVNLLQEQAQYAGDRVATLFEPGEKLGGWSGTGEQVYDRGWLSDFFSQLSGQPDIRFALLSEIRDHVPALGRMYFDDAASEGVGETVLAPDRFRQFEKARSRLEATPHSLSFLRAGYFRNLLVRYPEANQLHKRMVFVSRKMEKSRKSEERKAAARTELFKGQEGDAYRPGTEGGLYLPALREGAYRHLLRADSLLGENQGLQLQDFDACGQKEIVFDYKEVLLVISPQRGGSLMEFDVKGSEINWLATMTRYPENYHARLKKRAEGRLQIADYRLQAAESRERPQAAASEDIERYLLYDRLPRYSLQDHFYPLEASAQESYQGNPHELREVALEPRNYELERHKVIMSLIDFLEEKPSHLYKEIVLDPARALVTYDIHANFWQPYRFATEINTLPLERLEVDGRPVACDAIGEERKSGLVEMIHESGARLTIKARNLPFTVWYYPIETVTATREGIKRIYQGTALVLSWEQYKPAGVFEIEIAWARGAASPD